MRAELTAHPGDRLVIHPHRPGEPSRDAEILEALGSDGTPPFRVRWNDTGDVRLWLCLPGSDVPGSDESVDNFVERRRGADALEPVTGR